MCHRHPHIWARQPDTQPATTLAANGAAGVPWCLAGCRTKYAVHARSDREHLDVRATSRATQHDGPWKVTSLPGWTKLRQRFSPFRLIAPLDRPHLSCGPLLQPTDTQRQSKPRRTWKECGLVFFRPRPRPRPSSPIPLQPCPARTLSYPTPSVSLHAHPYHVGPAATTWPLTRDTEPLPPHPSLPVPSHPFKGWGACSSIPARTYDAGHQSHGQARLTRILAHSMPKRPGASSRYVSSPSPSRDTSPRQREPRCLAKQGLIITPVPMSPFAP